MRSRSAFGRVALAALLAAAALAAAAQQRPSQPESASGWIPKKLATAKKYMVVAAHPLATQAGLRMLDQGGSAMDAAIAAQLVLGLVEPQSSGLGGGTHLLVHDAKARKTVAYDGRETAPGGADSRLFAGPDGKPLAFQAAAVGGRSVGVPGTPRLLEVAHARHGRLPWEALFRPAIEIAEKGFPVSPRLHAMVSRDAALASQPVARDYFFAADGRPKAVGTLLRNPAYAATLRAIATRGADAFYTGDIAADIVAAVRNHENPGTMTLADLAGYRVRDVEPLCGTYRSWALCGMPPSSSGGIAVLQILGVLEGRDLSQVKPNSPESVHLLAEAGRLAYADRGRYVGDDRFVDVPVRGLVARDYIASRGKLIADGKSMGKAEPGTPAGLKVAFADDPVDEVAGTSHVSVVDGSGNAVSMTTTIEGVFGSKQMVRGFLLNSELTDFNFQPVEDGRLTANAVAPGKRPRSSMAPFIVFDGKTGRVEQVVGSPGGNLIINYVAKTLVATLDWKMDIQSAIDLPNRGSRGDPTEIEKGTELEKTSAALTAMGHDVRAIEMTSGLAGIRRTATGWEGGADPRREGVARGR